MTQPHEVTVSDAEVHAFYRDAYAPEQLQFEAHRQALAAFLAKRVPNARKIGEPLYWSYGTPVGRKQDEAVEAFNACRAAVLRGPQ